MPQTLVVNVPPAPGGSLGSPTGIVFSSAATDFMVTKDTTSGPSRFIFSTLDGTISGWAPNVDLNNAIVAAQVPGAVNTGLAVAATSAGNRLFATDFANGRVDTFDATFTRVDTAGGFVNPLLHEGYAPFNVQLVGGQLHVLYAKRDPEGGARPGKTKGFVDVFDVDGQFVRRLVKHRGLNAPWGVAMAPAEGFGDFNGALLVGNFGNGTIAGYHAKTGRFLGYLKDSAGEKLRIDGLWGFAFGNGFFGQDKAKLYFAAGVNDEEGGLYGSISLDAAR